MRILGIETSCDDTAAAVVRAERQRGTGAPGLEVLSNVVASQVKLHAKTGGIVPEVAARRHVEVMMPVIQQALREAEPRTQNPEPSRAVDAIAVTVGPGLITSLRIGVDTARVLSCVWKKPLVAVNHLEGHIYANWLSSSTTDYRRPTTAVDGRRSTVDFPVLALIVSGGHTELVLMRRHLDYKIIGATRDDAAGEAFDKVAKLLGLGYPGGPAISKLAEKGNPHAIKFPRPMIDSPDFDFSFAGLKTAVLYYTRKHQIPSIKHQISTKFQESSTKHLADICASFEQAAVDALVAKTIRAAQKYKVKTVILGGGVAANKRLRAQLTTAVNFQLPIVNCKLPTLAFTTDNAAMIAAAGAFHALAHDFTTWQKLDVDPNLSL